MFFNLTYSKYNFAHKFNEQPTKNDEFENHFHMVFEILLFIKGEAEFIIENKRFMLKPNDILFIPPGQHHNINVNPEIPYERYVVKFPEYDIPPQILSLIKNKGGNHSTENTILPPLFKRFDAHVENYHGIDLCGLLKCVLNEILYYLCSESRPYEYETYKEHMNDVISYINENITKKITLDDICKNFHYSTSYLCKEFQECMGVSIMKYVRTKKILHADSLIKSGIKPVELVDQCGFSDYSTFFRNYKNLLGKAPSSNK